MAIADAGVEISDMQAVGMGQYVIRMALNCTGRRNYLPEYKGRGCRPKWVKSPPLATSPSGKEIEATRLIERKSSSFKGADRCSRLG